MATVIVIENPRDWPLHVPDGEVVLAKSYLLDPRFSQMRSAKVYNFCRSYSYQSLGYYVSLLAGARGHKALPAISTIQDLRLSPLVRIASEELEEVIESSLRGLRKSNFELSVYFGRNMAHKYDRLSQALFNQFPAPFLRATFRFDEGWELCGISPIASSEIPDEHRPFVITRATEYFNRPRRATGAGRAAHRYDLAILVNEAAEDQPSNEKAIEKFLKAAKSVGLRADLIGKDDYGRLAEYDALFIRETTAVNHYTYRFARRAAAEGLVVMDDPDSILKCTNKVFLAEMFARHGIASPRTMVVHEDNIDEVMVRIGLPCVLKRPDSSFSRGVVKVETAGDLKARLGEFLEDSELCIAQEYLPSAFDWRVGVLDRRALFVCRYHMARGHWQIVETDGKGEKHFGKVEPIPIELAPLQLMATALRAVNQIGDGLYGVDIKQVEDRFMVIEVNDNPNIDAGYEDAVLKDGLYRHIMRVFVERLDARRR